MRSVRSVVAPGFGGRRRGGRPGPATATATMAVGGRRRHLRRSGRRGRRVVGSRCRRLWGAGGGTRCRTRRNRGGWLRSGTGLRPRRRDRRVLDVGHGDVRVVSSAGWIDRRFGLRITCGVRYRRRGRASGRASGRDRRRLRRRRRAGDADAGRRRIGGSDRIEHVEPLTAERRIRGVIGSVDPVEQTLIGRPSSAGDQHDQGRCAKRHEPTTGVHGKNVRRRVVGWSPQRVRIRPTIGPIWRRVGR